MKSGVAVLLSLMLFDSVFFFCKVVCKLNTGINLKNMDGNGTDLDVPTIYLFTRKT